MKVRISIAEDNNNLARSIQEKLELFSDKIEFRFRACNGSHLLELLKKDPNIDLILMDIEMPVMDGITAAGIVSREFPGIKILMLTVFDDDERIFKSIQAGAMGYLLKDESPDAIVDAIDILVSGGAAMSPVIAAKSLALLKNGFTTSVVPEEDFSLSKREIEILEQLSLGSNYIQIAEVLYVSPSTIRKHLENIYHKLHVHNKVQAVQKAREHRII